MAKKKLTTSKIALIQQRRAAGATFEDLARDFKLSVGTIANALSRRVVAPRDTKPAPKPAAGKDASGAELPTPEDLRRDLAGQIRSIRAEIESAETTPQMRASLNRILVGAQQLLARVTPPDPTVAPPGMVLVNVDEMGALAKQAERRLMALVDGMFADSETWPKCHACGQRAAPTDLGATPP
jgi:hypothetical protein